MNSLLTLYVYVVPFGLLPLVLHTPPTRHLAPHLAHNLNEQLVDTICTGGDLQHLLRYLTSSLKQSDAKTPVCPRILIPIKTSTHHIHHKFILFPISDLSISSTLGPVPLTPPSLREEDSRRDQITPSLTRTRVFA